ncbi:MAG: nicotinate (nicotinamide) nucleotide adenylyltransferase [Clostridia bacterium]|nr:nicotinate (nicotinamide) nucleotide adenylyltransferase [Clostridia bacterium]
MKTGIFGGSFNPPHSGHRLALDKFIEKLGLEKVYVIPSFVSPHKDTPELSASFEDRLEMCRLAFSGCDAEIVFSDIERRLFEVTGKKSYTANTLEALNEKSPYLFVGSDMFFTLDSWHRAEYLFENTVIAVMSRENDGDKVLAFKEKYERENGARIEVLTAPHIEISSTALRGAGKESPRFEHPDVAKYIEEHRLYEKKLSREDILKLIKERLPEKRFLHTLKVEKEALRLAEILCPDFKENVSRAALLHDVTKPLSLEEHLELKKDLSAEDLKSPETLHALTGAELAKRVLFENSDVVSMIKKHTTAQEEMSLLDMIIFVSDYVEETRTHTACISERERLHRELEECTSREEKYYILLDSVIRILENTLSYLEKKQSYIHPRTVSALSALRGKR